jgi:hypothetical protein
MKRAPIEPAPKMAKAIHKARKTGKAFRADGVSVEPPSKNRKTWRIRASFQGGQIERSAKDIAGAINSAFLEVVSILKSRQSGSLGLPEHANSQLSDALQQYIEQGGANFKWNEKTRKNRKEDYSRLIQLSKQKKVPCYKVNGPLLREYINTATRTRTRALHLKKMLRTFMRWAHTAGYVTAEQVLLVEQITWTPPASSGYVAAETRRRQSSYHYGTQEESGGQIPSHKQVEQFANACQGFYVFGEGLIHVSANIGSRANETFVFTADRKVYESGLGNFVDLENRRVLIAWQFNSSNPTKPKPTKTKSRRSTFIPFVENISTGFDVFEWLRIRSIEALKEQKQGKNNLALIFPNRYGKVHNLHSFTKSVIHPASAGLGWKMPPYFDSAGNPKHMHRFSLHSMRDRFGTTAADEWKYTERQLLAEGGWSDPQTVRKFYLGTSDDTHEEVRQIQSELAAIKRFGREITKNVITEGDKMMTV